MKSSTPWQSDGFYCACLEGDFEKARATFTYSSLDRPDPDGNTPLHIASSKGYIELIELLFRYHADRRLKNNAGLTAEQVAKDDVIKKLFQAQIRPKEDSEHFVGSSSEVEWLDNYKNAYRIAYENREHMKRWLLKVPLKKLLEEILIGYIEKMDFANERTREEVKGDIKAALDENQLKRLVSAYTSGGTLFCTKLNYNLAEIGSDFRFLSTQNLFNSGYLDNEAPKGLGQHIFAAILINHPFFEPYYHKGTTYRGMNITSNDLAQYKIDNISLTRSFLSTSKIKGMVELFKAENVTEGKQPVICVYEVINPRSSLDIEELSNFDEEKEVLIVPFIVFRVTKIDTNNPTTIYLTECV